MGKLPFEVVGLAEFSRALNVWDFLYDQLLIHVTTSISSVSSICCSVEEYSLLFETEDQGRLTSQQQDDTTECPQMSLHSELERFVS